VRTAILLVCADGAVRRDLRQTLLSTNFEVAECFDRAGVGDRCRNAGAVVFASASEEESYRDLRAAAALRAGDRGPPVILAAGESSEELAVAVLRSRVDDLIRLSRAAEELVPAVRRLLGVPTPREPENLMIGVSDSIVRVKAYLAKLAVTDSNVLITGETGTGKELAAEMVHRAGPRRSRPLVPVNCAAIPETLVESELFGYERGAFTGAHAPRQGKFQLAQGGTVFLDEIGDMDFGLQAKLLRAIESKEIHSLGATNGIRLNVRIVAATNQDPEELVRENRFRKDLYFRLNVARVHLAPLRQHKEDIPLLVEHAIGELNRRFGYQTEGCSADAYSLLLQYDWPGNVRELKNLLEATFVGLRSTVITPEDFPEAFHRNLKVLHDGDSAERERLLRALRATNWNKSKAAEALQWSRMTIYRKMAKHRLSRVEVPSTVTSQRRVSQGDVTLSRLREETA